MIDVVMWEELNREGAESGWLAVGNPAEAERTARTVAGRLRAPFHVYFGKAREEIVAEFKAVRLPGGES